MKKMDNENQQSDQRQCANQKRIPATSLGRFDQSRVGCVSAAIIGGGNRRAR